MTTSTYQDIPFAYHSGNLDDIHAASACRMLADLFTDTILPLKVAPFMMRLGGLLHVEGEVYRLVGVRLEVGKGEVGYRLLLKKATSTSMTLYRMAFPFYPLLTRLHEEGEPSCPLNEAPGHTAALVSVMDWIDHLHPSHGRGAGYAALELIRHLKSMAKREFKDGLALTLMEDSLVLSKGTDMATDETVYGAFLRNT